MPKQPTGRPRGRPPKYKPGDPQYEESAEAALARAEAKAEKEAAKPVAVKRDLAYFVDQLKLWRDKYHAAIESGSKEIPDLKAALSMVEMEARAFGYDFKSLSDTRPADEKFVDFCEGLASSADGHDAFNRLLEVAELDANAMRSRILEGTQTMVNTTEELIQRKAMLDEAEGKRLHKLEKAIKLGKALGELLNTTMALQRMAREEFPPEAVLTPEAGGWGIAFPKDMREDNREYAIRASRMIRHMTYVMRTNLTSRQSKGGSEALPDWMPHHAKIAMNFYEVWNWKRPTIDGVRPSRSWSGAVITMAPSHGKTFMAVGWIGLLIANKPYLKVHATHAVDDKASANLQWLGSLFDRTTPAGRRMTALYPTLKLKGKVSAGQFRLETPERSKQPTAVCNGVKSRIGGGDADIVWPDDAVDPLEREQVEERRRKKTFLANWLRRLREESGRFIITCTLEHEDDANFDIIRKSKAKILDVKVLRIPCGGPKGSTASRVPFHAIWPQVIGSSRLRREYALDPSGYAAQYMCDPSHDAVKIIKALRFYDPTSEEHAEFMRGRAGNYLSIDPSVTARQHADKTSFLSATLGDVSGTVAGVLKTERRLRITDARQFHCSMSDLVRTVATFVLDRPTDYIAIETVAAFASLPDTFKNELGVDVIACPTGNKSKEIRLRGVATLIDNSRIGDKDAGGAVVEFPGIVKKVGDNTILQPDPQFDWLYRQFLMFGTIKDDHTLDATTQLAAHLVRCGELQTGDGRITAQVRAVLSQSDSHNRIAKMLEAEAAANAPKGSPEDEEMAMIAEGGSSWMS